MLKSVDNWTFYPPKFKLTNVKITKLCLIGRMSVPPLNLKGKNKNLSQLSLVFKTFSRLYFHYQVFKLMAASAQFALCFIRSTKPGFDHRWVFWWASQVSLTVGGVPEEVWLVSLSSLSSLLDHMKEEVSKYSTLNRRFVYRWSQISQQVIRLWSKAQSYFQRNYFL